MRRRKQEGREGKGALQHHANPEKSAPSGRACLQKSYTKPKLNSVSSAVRSCIEANSNTEESAILWQSVAFSAVQLICFYTLHYVNYKYKID